MMRYFSVMSEMRRLEKSDMALKNQSNQASKFAEMMMDENEKLKEKNKKLKKLSIQKEEPSSQFEFVDDPDISSSIELLRRQKKLLEQKNKELMRELEQTKKDMDILKETSKQEAARQLETQKSLQRALEDYKLMALKSKTA